MSKIIPSVLLCLIPCEDTSITILETFFLENSDIYLFIEIIFGVVSEIFFKLGYIPFPNVPIKPTLFLFSLLNCAI